MQLLTGDRVAWVMQPHNRWSVVHRVFRGRQTFCSREIPSHARQPKNKQDVSVCSRCEQMYANVQKYEKTGGK